MTNVGPLRDACADDTAGKRRRLTHAPSAKYLVFIF
jgi:hypothetical protein